MSDYEKFIKFLKREKVYKKFFVNLFVPECFVRQLKPCFYFHVFLWDDSPEGLEFWSDLNKKWIDFLNKKED